MKTFHVDEPSEIGKKKQRISPKDKMMIKKEIRTTADEHNL